MSASEEELEKQLLQAFDNLPDDLTEPINPVGNIQKENKENFPIHGTSADLRRLSFSQTCEMLRSVGVTDKEIEMLQGNRWKMVGLIRELANRDIFLDWQKYKRK